MNHVAERNIRNKLVQNELLADETARNVSFSPGDANDPGKWLEDVAQNDLNGNAFKTELCGSPANQAVLAVR